MRFVALLTIPFLRMTTSCAPKTQQSFLLSKLTVLFLPPLLFTFFDFNSLNIKINPFLTGCIAAMVICISDISH